MDIKLLHLYPDLMNLYGSYANVSVLRRALENMGNCVCVESLIPGGEADIAGADFIFMGAGTERAQKAALGDLRRFAPILRAAAEAGTAMLFAGTAMELLGRSITDQNGKEYPALALADFRTVQTEKRMVEDVYGHCGLFEDPIVGFMNKSSVITGVSSPLLSSIDMGFGNDGAGHPEGYHEKNVFASELTGPLLVKNPALLRCVIQAIYEKRGENCPEIPIDPYMSAGYAVTAEQLCARAKG